jgi:hypothetical protein
MANPEFNWTDEELETEVLRLLPDGVSLVCRAEGLVWKVQLLRQDGDEVKPFWDADDFSRRGALFLAFEQVWQPPKHKPGDTWSTSRNRPSLQVVASNLSEKYADPGDLDVKEVDSVYSKH